MSKKFKAKVKVTDSGWQLKDFLDSEVSENCPDCNTEIKFFMKDIAKESAIKCPNCDTIVQIHSGKK